MAEPTRDRKRWSGTGRSRDASSAGEAGDAESPESRAPVMTRGVSQLLFTYLPERTVDWEDGLAIVQLKSVRLSGVWEDERKTAVLDELADVFRTWRERGGTVAREFPDPTSAPGEFSVGLPEAIEAVVLDTALVCQSCTRLHFLQRRAIAQGTPGRLRCPSCGRATLRQFGQVFVHGCGDLVPVTEWLPATKKRDDGALVPTSFPIRCPRCGPAGHLVMPLRSERVKDMKVVCNVCDTVVKDRLTARCRGCLTELQKAPLAAGTRTDGDGTDGSGDTIVKRILMRMTRYSASDAYYPQTLSMLRLDRPIVTGGTDPEQEVLQQLLPAGRRGSAHAQPEDVLLRLATQLKAAVAAGRKAEAARLKARLAQEVTRPAGAVTELGPHLQTDRLAPEVERSVSESLAFRQTVTTRAATQVARTNASAADIVEERANDVLRTLGLKELLVVDDLPVITASFGYTRRSFEPTYEETEVSSGKLPTCLRAFPPVDRGLARRLARPEIAGTVPILAREGEHEGLFLSLDPARVIRWLHANGIDLPVTEGPPIVRMLRALEPVDRYCDLIWSCRVRRFVYGLVHSLSHAAMRAATRFAGLERTSISEYVFLPLLGAVVFDNSNSFRLGGMETLARDNVLGFLSTLGDEATTCLYDPQCIDHLGACHGCIHAPEISCRVFNHGLSRSFLVGGHVPWEDVTVERQVIGYWTMDDA